jgi:hypothetical protein
MTIEPITAIAFILLAPRADIRREVSKAGV